MPCFDDLSVFDNVAFGLRRRRWEPARIKARVDARLDDVDLSAAATSLPSTLSGGMRKRVGIARATAIDASVGLFDDPIAGLDPLTGRRILGMLSRLTRDCGLATCIVANDLPQLLPHCDRVVMLHASRVVFEGLAARTQRIARLQRCDNFLPAVSTDRCDGYARLRRDLPRKAYDLSRSPGCCLRPPLS